MKRAGSLFAVLTFLLIVYEYAGTTVTYQAEHIHMTTESRGNEADIGQAVQWVLCAAVESTYEIQKIIWEPDKETEEEESPEQWMNQYVTGIVISDVSQEDVNRIAEMKNLRSLTMGLRIDDDLDLSPLANTNLLEFSLVETLQDDIDLTFLKELPYLSEIHCNKCTVLRDLSPFEALPDLRILDLRWVDDVDLNDLADCKCLYEVIIEGRHIRHAEALSTSKSLRHVALSELDPKEEPSTVLQDLYRYSDMCQLESVELRHMNIKDISPLVHSSNLRVIILEDTGVDDIESLCKLEHLEYLRIYGNVSERVKEQAELYFSDIDVVVKGDIQ